MKLIFALVTAFAFIAGAQAQEADTKKLVPGKMPSPSEVGKAVATDAKAAASATKDNAKGLVNNATQKPAADKPAAAPAAAPAAPAAAADKAMAKPAAAEAPKAAAPAKKSMKKGKKKARKMAK
jgi:hypothetical protein